MLQENVPANAQIMLAETELVNAEMDPVDWKMADWLETRMP